MDTFTPALINVPTQAAPLLLQELLTDNSLCPGSSNIRCSSCNNNNIFFSQEKTISSPVPYRSETAGFVCWLTTLESGVPVEEDEGRCLAVFNQSIVEWSKVNVSQRTKSMVFGHNSRIG